MNAAEIAEQAIAKQEAEEAGLLPEENTNGKDQPKGDNNDNADKKTDTPKKDEAKPGDDTGDKGSRGKDKGAGSDKDSDKKDDKEDGEFTADDALEEEVPEPKQPENAPTDSAGIVLSQDEQKFIADNIGAPIVIRGIQGTGDNAKEVEIKAFSPADIPVDFMFANEQQRMAAQTGFMSLEQRANKLLGDYRSNQSQASARDFERRENEGIRADIADLQKEGRFPKFKIQPGAAGFDDDPAAKTVSEVLKVMSDRNEMYIKQYEQGRPYKHIGFSEAYDIWEKTNPQKQAERKQDDDQEREDNERREVADRVGANRGLTQSRIQRPTVRPGTSIDEILARHELEDF